MKTQKIMFLISLLFLFANCSNRYEKEAMGHYKVESYVRNDSSDTRPINLPISLELNSNRTFSLVFKDSTVNGKWSADDYGDWTLLDLYFGSKKAQGYFGINGIEFSTAYKSHFEKFEKLVFKKSNSPKP